MALVVLMALLGSGLAHASRLCGVTRHTAASTVPAVRCPAHHAAGATAVPRAMGGPATPLQEPLHEREPACCANATSLAALPSARAEIARHDAAVALAPLLAVAARTLAPQACATSSTGRARAPVSGTALHLVHRVLLI